MSLPPLPRMESTAINEDDALSAAQHKIKSLAISKNAADDVKRILSDFDHGQRLSSISNLFPPIAVAGDLSTARRSSSPTGSLDWAERLIKLWDTSPEVLVFKAFEKDIAMYLKAVDVAIDHLACGGAVAVQLATVRLLKVFGHLMLRYAVSPSLLEPARIDVEPSWDWELEDAPISPQSEDAVTASCGSVWNPFDEELHHMVHPVAMDGLRAIVDRMVRAGHGPSVAQVYRGIRRGLLDNYLTALGVERLGVDEMQPMEWKQLNDKIKSWVQLVKTVVHVLLAGERRLCDHVLAVVPDELREECFLESSVRCLTRILHFGDAVADIASPRRPEMLFPILDMYEALAKVIPELKDLCSASSGGGVISDVQAILDRLGDAVRGTLFGFGKVLQQESSRMAMMAGEIHPAARYVMNYLRLLVVYSETLGALLPLDDDGDDQDAVGRSEDQEGMSPCGRRLLKLISYLEANLEEESKRYDHGAPQCRSSMNNFPYIVHDVNDSELCKNIPGDNWIRRPSAKIRQHARISWTRASSFSKSINEKFKNLGFEEIYRKQTIWKVHNPGFPEGLKISARKNVIPAYRALLGRNRG